MGRFDGRTAVVTGAGGEIGRAITARLAGDGARVLAVDLDPGRVEATVAAVEAEGGTVRGHVADVRDAAAVEAYADEGARLGGGHVDLFANNAGIEGPIAHIPEYADDDFDRVMAVNVRGVFLGLKHVLPRMRRGGAVVNTASTAGLIGAAGLVAYIASKHAVIGITRTAALEAAPHGIRVNAVCPGPVEGTDDDLDRARHGRRAGPRGLPRDPSARPLCPTRRSRLDGGLPAVRRGGLLDGRALRRRRRPDRRVSRRHAAVRPRPETGSGTAVPRFGARGRRDARPQLRVLEVVVDHAAVVEVEVVDPEPALEHAHRGEEVPRVHR